MRKEACEERRECRCSSVGPRDNGEDTIVDEVRNWWRWNGWCVFVVLRKRRHGQDKHELVEREGKHTR